MAVALGGRSVTEAHLLANLLANLNEEYSVLFLIKAPFWVYLASDFIGA
uniref:Uncharacterized protein n=1 Tax=Rhizophora mucronata TaxID=61149 RepID=A0A2P2NDP7_RHIMU